MASNSLYITLRNATISAVSGWCLCSGAGVKSELSKKVAFIFALNSLAKEFFSSDLFGNARVPFQLAVTTAAYGYTTFLFKGSEDFAKLTMLVKLASLAIVQPAASALMEKILPGKKNVKLMPRPLIEGGTFGVLAREVGYSNKVALAVSGLFTFASLFINNIDTPFEFHEYTDLSKLSFTNLLIDLGKSVAFYWMIGITLKNMVSKEEVIHSFERSFGA